MKKQNIANSDYLATLISLKERITQAQYKSYSAVNSEMILAYLDIGKIISQKTKSGWGTSVIKQLSVDLQAEFKGVKGFSERNLRLMRFVYEEIADNIIWQQLVAKLHWGHTVMIFSKIKDKTQREFYLKKAKEEAWSRSILEEKIKIDTYSQHKNYANEIYPDFNNIQQKMNDIINTIENNFANNKNIKVAELRKNKNNKAKIIDFFKSIDLCRNNCEKKNYQGLYVFAEKKQNENIRYLYTGITRNASQRLNDHINSSNKGSATWAYLMVKKDKNTNAELLRLIEKYHHKKKPSKIKEQLKKQIRNAIEKKQEYIANLFVTFIPVENDNYFLHMLEPYVAAKLKCYWNSFKTH